MPSEGTGDQALAPRPGHPDGLARAAGLAQSSDPAAGRRRLLGWLGAATKVGYSVAGLMLFILALETLKRGAGGLKPILNSVSADGVLNLLGFGWAGAYAVMSGSPVAAISLSLYAGGTISDVEAFAMINGTRLGASFIVLFAGFLLWVFRRRSADGLYIGVVALLTAFTLWLPVLPIGILALRYGWVHPVRLSTPGAVTSFVDVAFDPAVNLAADHLPRLMMFVLGAGLLLGAFTVFDRALPDPEAAANRRVERIKD